MLIIDTDPGVDDAHAIAMAAAVVPHDEIIVTTVAGNVPLVQVTENARWLAARLCPGATVYQGAGFPLQGRPVHADHVHGEDGLGGVPRVPADLAPLGEDHAALAIIRAARTHGNDLTIVALGPLTNIALALSLEPELPSLVGALWCMAGSPRMEGNSSVTAEFNVFADPVAAEMVFSRWPGATMVSWDLTLDNELTQEEYQSLWASGSPAAQLLRKITGEGDPHQRMLFPDPIAMALALHDDLEPVVETRPLLVGLSDPLTRGATFIDRDLRHPERAPIRVVHTVNRDALLRSLRV